MRPRTFLIWASGVVSPGKGDLLAVNTFPHLLFQAEIRAGIGAQNIAECLSLPRCILSFRDSNIANIVLN